MLPLRDVNPTRHWPVMTLLLIIACVGVWGGWQREPERDPIEDLVFNLEHAAVPCELTQGRPLTEGEIELTFGRFGGDDEACAVEGRPTPPAFADKSVWLAVVVSMFLHGSTLHIASNMLFLWIFGNNIEDHLGILRYVGFYLAGGIAATAAHVGLAPDSTVPVVGASGAIAAVMGAYAVWFPNAPVRSLVLLGFPVVLTVRAKWLLGIWFVTQFFTGVDSGVAWAAHVGGFVFGAIVGLWARFTESGQRVWWRPVYRVHPGRQRWDSTGGVGPVQEYRRVGRW